MISALQDAGAAGPSGALAVEFVIGRVLFSAMFIMSGIQHLTKLRMMSQYAVSQKVPAPTAAVAVTGLMLLAGGLSIQLGTLLLVVFLVPTAFVMHRFWGIPDPMQAAVQQAHFMKNITLAGAALLICYFTSVAPG